MFTPFELVIALVNITFRIILFYIFWLPSIDVDVDYANRTFSFVNEKWAWSQKPYSNISLLTNATTCPSNQVLLTQYIYHLKSTNSLLSREMDNSIKLNQWSLLNSDKSFILCGTTINTTFIQQASKNQTCEQQGLKDCGNGDIIQFCVSQDSSCPITSFSIDETLKITNNIDSNQMPLALIRIDSYWPCLTSNKTNVFPDYIIEMDIGIGFEKCDTLDTSYQSINNITDLQFYKINNQLELYTGQEFTKGLFYKQYPKWKPACNGEIFKQALALIDQQNLFVYSSGSIYLLVIIYLLICNYAIPTIPFLLRCIESFSLRLMIRLDYLARIVLSILLVYYSVTAYLQSLDLLQQIEIVYDYHCVDDQINLDNLYDATENHKDLNLAAILIFAICWGIEIALLFGYGLQSLIVKMCRCWRQEKFKSQKEI